MKYFAPVSAISAVIMALVIAPDVAQAQAIKVDIKDVNVETMPTPQFSYDGETKKLPSAREWVEIEVEFEAESEDRNAEFIDDIEFTYYVALTGKEGGVMLVQEVVHVNVPVKSEIFSNVFISPATIQKITGSEANSASIVGAVAVEVRYKGAPVAREVTDKESTNWWQTMQRTEGMLLSKRETPFAILWTDRYAEEKKRTALGAGAREFRLITHRSGANGGHEEFCNTEYRIASA